MPTTAPIPAANGTDSPNVKGANANPTAPPTIAPLAAAVPIPNISSPALPFSPPTISVNIDPFSAPPVKAPKVIASALPTPSFTPDTLCSSADKSACPAPVYIPIPRSATAPTIGMAFIVFARTGPILVSAFVALAGKRDDALEAILEVKSPALEDILEVKSPALEAILEVKSPPRVNLETILPALVVVDAFINWPPTFAPSTIVPLAYLPVWDIFWILLIWLVPNALVKLDPDEGIIFPNNLFIDLPSIVVPLFTTLYPSAVFFKVEGLNTLVCINLVKPFLPKVLIMVLLRVLERPPFLPRYLNRFPLSNLLILPILLPPPPSPETNTGFEGEDPLFPNIPPPPPVNILINDLLALNTKTPPAANPAREPTNLPTGDAKNLPTNPKVLATPENIGSKPSANGRSDCLKPSNAAAKLLSNSCAFLPDSAIASAVAWFCFSCLPDNFELVLIASAIVTYSSVDIPRAAAVSSNISWLLSALSIVSLTNLSCSAAIVPTSLVKVAYLNFSKLRFWPNIVSACISASIDDWKSKVFLEAFFIASIEVPSLAATRAVLTITSKPPLKELLVSALALAIWSTTAPTWTKSPVDLLSLLVVERIDLYMESKGRPISTDILNKAPAFSAPNPIYSERFLNVLAFASLKSKFRFVCLFNSWWAEINSWVLW